MFKKSLASIVTAAFVIAGPGNLSITAAAQTMGRASATGVSVTPAIGAGLNSPSASFNMPAMTPGALTAPTLAAPSVAAPAPVAAPVAAVTPVAAAAAVTPAASAVAKSFPANSYAALRAMQLPAAAKGDSASAVAAKGVALNAMFDNSRAAAPESLAVLGSASSVESGLSRSEGVSALTPASIESARVEKASAAGELAIVNLLKRAWNAILGAIGLGVKKAETPEVMAQRIIDQLNAQKPIYNRKVQEASTLVEKLKLQVQGEEAKVKELETGITAILSDSDPNNDVMASGMINQQKTLNASIAATKEQITLAEATLQHIKDERASFFSDREEMLAKIQAGLTKSKSAEIQKQIAELKGGFQVGDLKDNMDKFDQAVDDKVADAKGTVDSVESNPDQILKKAKDSLKSQEIQDEIAKRKAAIEAAKKDKGQAGGGVVISSLKAASIGLNVVMAAWAGLNTGWIAMLLAASAVSGIVMPLGGIGAIAGGVFAEKVLKTSGAKTAGAALLGGVIGFAVGLGFVGLAAYVGFAVASPFAAAVLAVVALGTSLADVGYKAIFKKDKPAAPSGDDKGQAGGKLAVVDVVYFSAMGVLMGISLTMLSGFWPVAAAAALAGVFGLLTAKVSRNLAGNGRSYDYTGNIFRASAVGMALHTGYALFVGAAFVPGLVGAVILGAAARWAYRQDAKQDAAKNDKGDAGGAVAVSAAAESAGQLTMVLGSVALLFGSSSLVNLGAAAGLSTQMLIVASIFTGMLPLLAAGLVETIWNRVSPSDEKGQTGGLILELGVGAALIAVVAAISAPFRNLLARAWNAALGAIGLGVKKMETPEVMAQRIIDQLNAQKPVYNRKVQEASTLVEKLRLQIEKQEAQSKELDRSVTAILSDSDPNNDVMAESLLNQKKTVDASTVMTKEQMEIAAKTLDSIKEERARFFSEREEMLAKIQAGLTKSKSAEIQKQIAELKGGFQVGDLKDNMDKFDQAVDDKVADAKGTVDSVESNPDQILKKAKDSLKNQEVQDEIAKRKAAIEAARKDKGSAAGSVKSVWSWLNDGTPFGSYKSYSKDGRIVRVYGWSLSGRTFFQSAVLGLVAGPIIALLGMATLPWAIGGMAAAPFVVDLLKPTWIYTNQPSDDKGQTGGLILELGIGAAVIAVVAAISAPFRNLLARMWNAALGAIGLGVKKMETPEVMAQRIIDQLNAQKPVYNRKVQEASTLVEKLRLQIEKQEAQSKELDRSVTAILSDSDPNNDVMAESLLNQKKTVDASTVMTKEQMEIAAKTLDSIKEERARFFSEREEMLAKIQAGLTKSKSAEIQKQIAELKGGFQVGDLKDNMDKFDQAVDDKVADAKGTVDSVESNPDQILKKAKDSLKNQEVQDEIAKRKAAIEAARKDKGQAGGDASQSKALGYFAKAIGIGFALISPWIASAVFALLGLVSIAMAPEQGRWFGRQLAVIGLGTLAIGGAATFLGAKIGLAVGAFGIGMSFIVPAGIALAAGVIAALRAHNKANGAVADAASTPAGHSVLTPAPVAAPSAPAETSAPKASSPKASFSIKPLIDLMARAWNALLGIFGMGVKKMETPEIMAQRLIDQLNDAKPVYNNKVREASTLVEKLRQQIAGEQAKIAEFDKTITAILSDNDPSNDVQAAGLLNSQKTLEASVAASKEQLASSEKALENIKEERARFFSEREETLAKIQAGLTKVKSAEIQKQIAELKGGFQIGDLKDNMDRFDTAVNDKIADAKGATDSVESNPDEVLKKAKGSLRTAEINDEIAKRKAAIEAAKKDKGAAGGQIPGRVWGGVVLGLAAEVAVILALGWPVAFPFVAALARAGMIAGFIGQISPDAKIARGLGTVVGGLVAAATIGGLLPVALGLLSGYVVSGFFADSKKPNSGIMDAIASVFAGMIVGMTLPAWLGGLAAKKSLERSNDDKGDAGGAVGSRDLTMTEIGLLNVAGIAAAIGVGFLTHSFWIGLGLTYVAAIPLIYLYTAVRNAFGAGINAPKFSFAPSFSWAGKSYGVRSAKDEKGDGAGAVDAPMTAAQAEQGILAKTYSWMTLGLGITAAAAQAAIVTGIATTVLASLPMMIGLAILQLGLVIGLSLAINKLSPGAALAGFLAYSAVNGLFLAPLVAMFTVGSVAASFLVTAGMFGTMAVLGHTVKVSLNSVGSYGMMALMGIILASVANMFLHSTGLGAILTYATILVFVGLTAYDAQKIKEMAQRQGTLTKDDQSRIAVMGALTLYLDFINLFIQILKIMGKAKSRD